MHHVQQWIEAFELLIKLIGEIGATARTERPLAVKIPIISIAHLLFHGVFQRIAGVIIAIDMDCNIHATG